VEATRRRGIRRRGAVGRRRRRARARRRPRVVPARVSSG